MSCRIGIDAGSKTIKVVAMDQDGTILRQVYRRHRSNIIQTLKEVLHDVQWMLGEDVDGPVAFTGSAGIGIADELGAPFIQEVIATSAAVKEAYPQADAVIELGGEDAKVIYLTGGVEQRMNASCAGGTGGFIDTIAFMLGVRTNDMDRLAFGCRHFYPIASRCAVFAQTDIRPLINAGVPKSDLAGSVFRAVVRQTLGGLACGRPLRGTIVFLGGPLEHNDSLVNMFRQELNLTKDTGIKPKDAHLFTARGAAFFADEQAENSLTLSELVTRLEDIDILEDDLDRLPPLFTSEEELEAFRERHKADTYPQKTIFHARGPLYLGIDAGSTTVKLAVLDQEGTLVHYEYELTGGDTALTLRNMLVDLYRKIPEPYTKDGEEIAWIARSMVTGYGEDMIRALFGVDSGVVETAAHLRAARQICPDVSFILDIGGQDMKALWVKDGIIIDAVLNEACSSGCGSFIEGTSYSLKSSPYNFAKMALTAEHPIDLGTRCTVFMTSRVRHAQKIGAGIDDIAAGIAYSVVQNALFRIIGAERVASMGDHIVVQGGTFKSDAVLRAFELVSGREVIRNDQSHLMGAIGAAFLARDEAEQSGIPLKEMQSGMISVEEMRAMTFKRKSLTCTGCANACPLSMISASDEREFISGNRCNNGLLEFDRQKMAVKSLMQGSQPTGFQPVEQTQTNASAKHMKITDPPSVFVEEQELLAAYDGTHKGTSRANVNIGLMNAMELYGTVPFWHGVLSSLGFTVTVDPPSASDVGVSAAWETIPSESVCYPAKLAHVRYFNLANQGVDAVFMPHFKRRAHCVVAASYVQALADNLPEGAVPLVAPQLSSYKPQTIVEDDQNVILIKQALADLAAASGCELTDEEVQAALRAGLAEQQEYDDQIQQATKHVLDWIAADPSRRGVVLAGRSYHSDPAVSKGIDVELQKLSVAVLSMRGLNQLLRAQRGDEQGAQPLDPHVWRAAKRLRSIAEFAAINPQIDVVCLQSFGCGYDAVSFQEVSGILEKAEKPLTVLKIDDITDLAHIRIRLRTLVDAIQKRSVEAPDSALPIDVSAAPEEAATDGKTATDDANHACSFADAVLDFDLTTLRQDAVKDACFTAQTMAAHAIKLLSDDPRIDTIELPLVCKDCLFDAVPLMVERAVGRPLNVEWVDVSDLCSQLDYTSMSPDDDDRPRIGIVGNALMCYQPALNDDLVNLLDSLGIRAVLPDADLIQNDDVRYEEQLERYEQAGLTEVIYVQSFGCLKGHVQSRGALHSLKKRFPNLNITVIDYDPEASALNRENRIRLVAESLKRELVAEKSIA